MRETTSNSPFPLEHDGSADASRTAGAGAAIAERHMTTPATARERNARPRRSLSYLVADATTPQTFTHAACRMLNFAVALVGLIIASPLMLVIAIFVAATSRGPVLYRQQRVGRDRRAGMLREDGDERNVGGRPFTIFKFRTMRAARATEPQVWASRGDPRVTRVGGVLRATRVDELPQLLNVLRGDMNIVGPRPEQVDIARELRRTIPGYAERHCVLPGITGLAQTTHGYDESLEDVRRKIALDLEYVRRRSPVHDIRIMAKTPFVMLGGLGVFQSTGKGRGVVMRRSLSLAFAASVAGLACARFDLLNREARGARKNATHARSVLAEPCGVLYARSKLPPRDAAARTSGCAGYRPDSMVRPKDTR